MPHRLKTKKPQQENNEHETSYAVVCRRRAGTWRAAILPFSAFGGRLAVLLPPWVTLPKEMTDTYKSGGLDIQTLGWDEIRTKIVTSMLANTAPASVDRNGLELGWPVRLGRLV